MENHIVILKEFMELIEFTYMIFCHDKAYENVERRQAECFY